MNTLSNKPLASKARTWPTRPPAPAQSAIQSTQRAADSALDSLSAKVEDLRGQAAPLLNRVSSQAEAAARRGIEAVRDTSQQLREKAQRASDSAGRLRQGRADQGDADRRRDRRPADGPGRAAQPLVARLTSSEGRAMIHPLLRLITTEPHLLGDHVEPMPIWSARKSRRRARPGGCAWPCSRRLWPSPASAWCSPASP
jgi:hypothetical protein